MTWLFKAYVLVPDDDFKDYIKDHKNDYEDGKIDLNADELMKIAKNKYEILKEQGTWQKPSKEGEEIIALKAEIAQLRENKKRPNGSKSGKGKTSKDKNNDEKHAWKKIKIEGKDILRKNGKIYYWCQFHKAYTIHSPKACSLNPENSGKNKEELASIQAQEDSESAQAFNIDAEEDGEDYNTFRDEYDEV